MVNLITRSELREANGCLLRRDLLDSAARNLRVPLGVS
jgi:hypothetical protein